MNNFIKKGFALTIILALFIYTLPVYAIKNEETVYSKLNSKGERYKTIVSTKKEGEITETEIDKDLPINCDVEYELNGKKISADELVGKSGNVKIVLNYTNKSEKQVSVNGRTETMYTPFVVISGTIIDGTNNKNIKITNGKLIENDDNTIVVGIALPGITDSLKLPKSINDLNKIEISMETTNFEMENIITFCTPKVLDSDIDWDVFNGIFDEIGSLEDASNQIENGIVDLKDGIMSLNNGAQDLKTGTREFANQSQKFNQAMNQISDGINELSANYTQINSGISDLNNNSKELNDGVKEFGEGISGVAGALTSIDENVGELNSGIDNLSVGATSLYAGIGNILEAIQSLGGTDNTEQITQLQTLVEANRNNITNLENINRLLTIQINELPNDNNLKQLLENQRTLNEGNVDCLRSSNTAIEKTITQLRSTDVTSMATLVNGLGNLKNGAKDLADRNPKFRIWYYSIEIWN